jgi:hypothetical protein
MTSLRQDVRYGLRTMALAVFALGGNNVIIISQALAGKTPTQNRDRKGTDTLTLDGKIYTSQSVSSSGLREIIRRHWRCPQPKPLRGFLDIFAP